jgi:RNA polymerase sigma-70 factor, ECF subfamily
MDEIKKQFGDIYDENIDNIYRFIYIKVNSRDLAEDLTAETFTKAWKAYKSSYRKKKTIDNPKAFCYRTARNLVTDYYRKKGRVSTVSLESVQLADTGLGIEEKAMINSDIDYIMKNISSIKDEYQDVIIWRYLDELTVTEISDLLNKSEDATRVTIHRAISSLRKALES